MIVACYEQSGLRSADQVIVITQTLDNTTVKWNKHVMLNAILKGGRGDYFKMFTGVAMVTTVFDNS